MGHTIEKDPSLYQEPSGEEKRHHVTERPAVLEAWPGTASFLTLGRMEERFQGEESSDQASKVGWVWDQGRQE